LNFFVVIEGGHGPDAAGPDEADFIVSALVSEADGIIGEADGIIGEAHGIIGEADGIGDASHVDSGGVVSMADLVA
jgi:hypothetical protein